MKRTTTQIVRWGLGALGAALAGGAVAEPMPLYVGVDQAISQDSNLFRAAQGLPETRDRAATTSLLAGLNVPFGPQRFTADLAARHTWFQDNDQLNNTGYTAQAGLDWESAGQLSGRFAAATDRRLAAFGADGGPVLTTANEQTSQDYLARVQWGRSALMTLEGGLTHRRLEYSAPEYNYLALRQTGASVGLLYRPSGLLTLGLGLRHTRGSYPFATVVPINCFCADDFHRNDVDMTAEWVPTGLSTVKARVSYTSERHAQIPVRDVAGVTAALRWEYKPTAKLEFSTEALRETGAEAAFYRISAGGDSQTGSGSRLATSLQLAALYKATAKVQLLASGRVVERDLISIASTPSGVSSAYAGTDRYSELRLGLNYMPTNAWLIGCSAGREHRSASSSMSYAYDATVASCHVQLKTQH